MTELVVLREELAAELARWGRLGELYVRRGPGLVAVRARRGRVAPWGRPRFLGGDSALVRSLEGWPGCLLRNDAEGDPFGQALLEELKAEAVVLIRDRSRLLAAASLSNLDGATPPVESELRRVAARFAARLLTLENPRGAGHDRHGVPEEGRRIPDPE